MARLISFDSSKKFFDGTKLITPKFGKIIKFTKTSPTAQSSPSHSPIRTAKSAKLMKNRPRKNFQTAQETTEYSPKYEIVYKKPGAISIFDKGTRRGNLFNTETLTKEIPHRVPNLECVDGKIKSTVIGRARSSHKTLPPYMVRYTGRTDIISETSLRLNKFPERDMTTFSSFGTYLRPIRSQGLNYKSKQSKLLKSFYNDLTRFNR